MSGLSATVGKLLYAALFVVVLPLGLALWARGAAANVPLPALASVPAGAALAAAGALLMAAGGWALARHGNGLPMSPYPPDRLVTRGIYRLVPHPIYAGFAVACLGVSLAAGSAAGLWLVTPIIVAACAAFVLGYERLALRRRFGAVPAALLHLPAGDEGAPAPAERVSVVALVLLPWLLVYEAALALGAPPDAITVFLPGEATWPVWEWTEAIYASTYVVVLLAPALAPTRRGLRRFAVRGLVATAVITVLYLTVPIVAPPRPFSPHGPLGRLLLLERGLDGPACAFPSFHVVWAMLAAGVLAERLGRLRVLAWVWALAVAASCVTTGMHAALDVVAGFAVAALLLRLEAVWEALRRVAERAANSWREWRFGPVRVINHGAWAGAGTFVGLAIAGALLGNGRTAPLLLVATCSLVAAALWAQYIEGSPRLLRPYGFYGGVLGVVVGALAAPAFATSPWLVLAAFSVAGPWIQAGGRVRCLVQGCCHGAPAPVWLGIVYTHPRSRVVRLSDLAGVPVHPTPLYSILWNAVIALAMARLWWLHAALPLIAGLYLVLTGLGRFVEEAYRGEPQTLVVGGLRLYQWIAIATVCIGAALTTIPGAAAPAPQLAWSVLLPAAAFAVLVTVALGVDFPASDRRFARLA